MPERTFSRENSSRRPSFFTTMRWAVCTRSKVVKRLPQDRHSRRLRMPSSASLESITFESSNVQYGQRIAGLTPSWRLPYVPLARRDKADNTPHVAPVKRFNPYIMCRVEEVGFS